MTLETTLPENRTGQLGAESPQTGHGFADTMEVVEDGVRDGVHQAHDAVTGAAGAVTDGVEATGRAVRAAAHDTADAFAWALDVPGHVARHPWLLVGAAVLVGLLILRARRRE
jgi:hypothetical protein